MEILKKLKATVDRNRSEAVKVRNFFNVMASRKYCIACEGCQIHSVNIHVFIKPCSYKMVGYICLQVKLARNHSTLAQYVDSLYTRSTVHSRNHAAFRGKYGFTIKKVIPPQLYIDLEDPCSLPSSLPIKVIKEIERTIPKPSEQLVPPRYTTWTFAKGYDLDQILQPSSICCRKKPNTKVLRCGQHFSCSLQ